MILLQEKRIKNYFNMFELKYEILAYIPFFKKKIAIGSINYHLDTFGDAFNIKVIKKRKNVFRLYRVDLKTYSRTL